MIWLAGIFNPPFRKEWCRHTFDAMDTKTGLWILDRWWLYDGLYELLWTLYCPRPSWRNGERYIARQSRTALRGDAVYFLDKVWECDGHVNERWVCRGWWRMPRWFVV